jgi:hypothetical protein
MLVTLRFLAAFLLVMSLLTQNSKAQSQFQFGAPATYSVPPRPSSIAVGDLNGDGKPDVVIANNTGTFGNNSSGSITVLLNNGNGTFPATSQYPVEPYPWTVALADVNNDGKLDIVSSSMWNGDVYAMLGNGDGTFSPPISSSILAPPYTSSGYIYPQGVALGDLNDDGYLDVVLANEANVETNVYVTVLFGNGTGHFNSPTNYVAVYSRSLVLADFNHDGKLDIAVNGEYDSIGVLLNNGNGTFSGTTNFARGDSGGESDTIVTADFNGDGIPDLATANNDSQSVSVLLGQGDGSFSNAVVYPVSDYARGLAAGDFDYDGKVDLVASTYGGNLIILKGNGDGTFSIQPPLNIGGISFAVAAADFDTNGTPDLVKANLFDNTLNVLLNFTPPRLTIAKTNNQIALTWPQLSGYILESSTNLLSGNWMTVTNSFFSISGRFWLTNSMTDNAQFYRLKMTN